MAGGAFGILNALEAVYGGFSRSVNEDGLPGAKENIIAQITFAAGRDTFF